MFFVLYYFVELRTIHTQQRFTDLISRLYEGALL